MRRTYLMMEHNTDRLFWTLSAIIVTSLVFIIGVKLFPNTAKSIRNTIVYSSNSGKDHKSVNDTHYNKIHKEIQATQRDNDMDTNYNFNYSSSDDTATVTGFKSNPNSKKIIIPNTIKHNGKNYRVTMIAPNSFAHAGLESVVLPENLQTVGMNAFQYNNISDLTINDNLKSIQAYAFDSNNLSSLQLPSSDSLHIDANAFTNNNLTSVTLPNKNIDSGAFDSKVNFRYQLANNASKDTEVPYNNFKNINFRNADDNQKFSINANKKNVVDHTGKLVKNTFVKDSNDNLYYINSAGIPMTGIQYLNGQTYYFDTNSGIAQTSTIENQNGNMFYFNKNGHMVYDTTVTYQGVKYNVDKNGILTTNLKQAKGTINNGGIFQ